MRGDKKKSTGSVFADKGMAIACLGLVLGLVFMFTHAVVLADGMPNMDVHAAGWAWLVVLTSGYGLYLMFKVTTADPGFADAKDAAAVLDTRVRSSKRDGGALRRHEAQNGANSQSGPTVWDLPLIQISEPTRLRRNSYAAFCLKKKKKHNNKKTKKQTNIIQQEN